MAKERKWKTVRDSCSFIDEFIQLKREMSQHKLTYFNIRGLGEGARLIFHQAGVEFEDNRLSREDWPSLKPSAFSRKFSAQFLLNVVCVEVGCFRKC